MESPLLTVNLVTYQRHDEFRSSLQDWLSQTDQRFILDVWQDGPDDLKRKIVSEFNDPRIQYHENEERKNLFGHDMRRKSLENCTTPYWCTTNDDNITGPDYVKTVLGLFFSHNTDAVKTSVAMYNRRFYPDCLDEVSANLMEKNYDPLFYKQYMSVLDARDHVINQVDAASFVVNTEKARQIGWNSIAFAADWEFWKKFMETKPTVACLNQVFQVHV